MHTGLIKCLKVPPKTIHDRRVRGVLVDEIKATFYDVPEGSRGRYFCWFLQNEHIVALAGQPLPDETFYDHAAAMLLHACRFTEGSERDSAEEVKAAIACKPDQEQECLLMYTVLLSKEYPSPDLWVRVDFGFASRKSRGDEAELSSSYQHLIAVCTFEASCDAHHTYHLLDLFDSKGLQAKHRGQMRDLLQGDRKKSVWYLKQTIAVEDSTKEEQSIRDSVMVDYGFINCRNHPEKRRLMRVYKAFFNKHDGDPWALHEATMKGNIP